MAELGPESPALHQQVWQEARRLGIDRIVPVGEAMELASGEGFAPPGLGGGLSGQDLTAIGRLLAATTSRGDVVLFKASRSVGLERALDALLAELSEGQG
jgi:UDP-N-acetylmuramoyl-tripeptide--D-alanyl-D-alanine ligase